MLGSRFHCCLLHWMRSCHSWNQTSARGHLHPDVKLSHRFTCLKLEVQGLSTDISGLLIHLLRAASWYSTFAVEGNQGSFWAEGIPVHAMLMFTSPVETKFMQINPFLTSMFTLSNHRNYQLLLSQVCQSCFFSGNLWHSNYGYLNIYLVEVEHKIADSSSSKPFL